MHSLTYSVVMLGLNLTRPHDAPTQRGPLPHKGPYPHLKDNFILITFY